MNNIAEEQLKGDDPKVTLYKRLRSVGETIQFYEDDKERTYIKIGHFFCEIEVDDDGHLKVMLGEKHLEKNVRSEYRKAIENYK